MRKEIVIEETAYISLLLKVLKVSASILEESMDGNLRRISVVTSKDDFYSVKGEKMILERIQKKHWGFKRVVSDYFDAQKKLMECKNNNTLTQEEIKDTLRKLKKLIEKFEKIKKRGLRQ